MSNQSHKEYLHRLREIGVRTDKKMDVMYCDLFRITENAFLKECHATKAFELYDFVKEKVKVKELHELRRHLEGLLLWMYPDEIPYWPKNINRRFKELANPYLEAGFEPLRIEDAFGKSPQWISATFNIRCGKPRKQFVKDREILLKKLENRQFCLVALEKYDRYGRENAQIPLIGLDLMNHKLYILEPGESFLQEKAGAKSIAKGWQKKYKATFNDFSDLGLSLYFNKRVGCDNSTPAWRGILSALKDQLSRRKIDFSSIEAGQTLNMKQCVVLVNNKMKTAKELPKKVLEGMVMMMYREKYDQEKTITITKIDDHDIYYRELNDTGAVTINHLFKFHADFVLNQ